MATTVLGLKTFAASDPVDYNEINDNYNKIDTGVKTALQGRAAHNLLDNSDFRDPVNQRGFSSTTSTGESMGIDRWLFSVNSGGSLSLTADGLVCQNANLIQKIESKLLDSSKEYTQVFWLSDGTPVFPTKLIEFNYSSGVGRVVYYGITGTIAAAALYEGSYTADTLPAYVPKGYAAELAECMRYFERLGVVSSEILGTVAFAKSGAKSVIISMQYQPKRVGKPTLVFGDVSKYRLLFMDAVNASVFSASAISSFDEISVQSPFASFRVTIPNPLDRDCWVRLQREDNSDGAYIDVNADM